MKSGWKRRSRRAVKMGLKKNSTILMMRRTGRRMKRGKKSKKMSQKSPKKKKKKRRIKRKKAKFLTKKRSLNKNKKKTNPTKIQNQAQIPQKTNFLSFKKNNVKKCVKSNNKWQLLQKL